MASRFTILKRSAVPEGTKLATATAEFNRRLKRTSTLIGRKEQERILEEYVDDLRGMGYQDDWIKRVLGNTMKGYMKVLGMVQQGETTRNRSGAATEMKRRFNKLCGK